jgi:hypothetical protein
MSGRHKFSELEATMTPAARTRVRKIAENLEADVVRKLKRAPEAPANPEPADTPSDTLRKVARV